MSRVPHSVPHQTAPHPAPGREAGALSACGVRHPASFRGGAVRSGRTGPPAPVTTQPAAMPLWASDA
eukprot:8001434-Prorocentrum_lima.AAC.1